MLLTIKHCPFWSLHCIFESSKVSASRFDQLEEFLVINPSLPLSIHLEGSFRNQHAARVFMLTRDFVAREQITETATECNDLVMVRHILHGQVRSAASTAESHALDLDEVRIAQANKVSVFLQVSSIVSFDESKTEYSSEGFASEILDAGNHALPVVFVERAINLLQIFGSRGVDGEVELSNRNELFHLFRELSVGDEEGRDVALVKKREELVDFGIHDRFADE
jgi:hypothetical protein